VSRALLVTATEKGHLNPAVGLARWLRRDGHHVGWLTLPEPAPQLAALDVEPLEMRGAPPPPPLVTGGEALAHLVRDAAALRSWIHTLLIDAVPGQIDPLRRAVTEFGPDIVALDGMLYQAVIACELEGVPWAGVSSALTLLEPPEVESELMRTLRGLAAEREALFESHGLKREFRTCECLSPRLNLIFAGAELVGRERVPPHTRLVGPARPSGPRGDEVEFPWERLDATRPLVYVSFGSQISWQPELLRSVALAAAELGAQPVLSAGALAGTDFAAGLPGDPVVREYVPQLALLERASVLVTHGGANSFLEAVGCGVPQIVIPICNDQPVQAWYAERAGTGIALDSGAVDVASCREALARLLAPESPERVRVRQIAAAWADRDGGREGARLVGALAG
jgi:MGT family glycosyltransferase